MTMILEELKNEEVVGFIQHLIRNEVDRLSKEENRAVLSVRRSEFDELKDIVRELAAAQKETGKELHQLASAQKRTELKVEQLAEAQKRTEIKLEALAEAQKRTELKVEQLTEKVEQLAEAQRKTELKVEQLAEAQKNTEMELRTLTKTVKNMQKEIGGLSTNIGYGIEDKIIPYMFDFGKKQFGIDVMLVERKNIFYPDGRYDQINIYAEGLKNGMKSYIVGECKAQPGKKDADKFGRLLRRLKTVLSGNICPFIAGYDFTPDVEAYIRSEYPDINMYKTYEFEMKFRKILP